jgi:hypothetical protein
MLTMENVVAQDQAHRIITDELLADDKRLGQAIRDGCSA